MNRATQITTSTMGVLAGLSGIEHGIGEVMQGNVAPNGTVIQSWPESDWFHILGGEPAMTIVPNVLVTGLLAILFSLLFLLWATLWVERNHSGLILLLLSLLMLLFGAGFGPPLLGIIVATTATRIHAPLTWWRARLSPGVQAVLARLWPWAFAACLAAWFYLLFGVILLAAMFGESGPILLSVFVAIVAAFGLLLLTIVCAFARDLRRQRVAYPMPVQA